MRRKARAGGGAAGNRPDLDSLRVLAGYRRWWVATDQDDAGRKAQAELLQASARARPLALPDDESKDITDAWKAGADLAQWVARSVGLQDPNGFRRWAEYYLEALDAQGPGTDKANPTLRVWLSLWERYTQGDAL